MACDLSNIIGIKGLCNTDTSNMLLLDNEGVSLKVLSRGADESYANAKLMFNELLQYAWLQVLSDYRFGERKGYKIKQIYKPITVQGVVNTGITSVQSLVNYNYTDECNITQIFVNHLILHVKTGGITTVKVNGIVYYSGSVANNQILQIPINSNIGYTFAIDVDLTNITVYGGTNYGDLSTDGYNGINVTYTIKCDIESYLCQYADVLKYAVYYKLLGIIWYRLANTSRLNDFIDIKIGEKGVDAMFKASLYDSLYNEMKNDPSAVNKGGQGRYQLEMDKVNGQIPLPECKCCLECTSDKIITILT